MSRAPVPIWSGGWANSGWPDRSTGDLLDDPLAFSQTSLLTADQFCKEAEKCGVKLEVGELEQLHRRRALLPLFTLHREPVVAPGSMRSAGLTAVRPRPGRWLQEVLVAAGEGRLTDPAACPFQPWPKRPDPYDPIRLHLYGTWQTLGLERMAPVLRYADRSWVRRSVRYDLPPVHRLTRDAASTGRRLAIALEALDGLYRPSVFARLIGDLKIWNTLNAAETATDILKRLSVDGETLRQQAEFLLAIAHGDSDPLGKWSRVVRHANFEGLDTLRGEARVTMNYRIAAEYLLLLYEELARDGAVADLEPVSEEWWQPRHDRLTQDRDELDRALFDLGVSTHPTLVIAVEGETEELLLPRVLAMVGMRTKGGSVEIVNLRGIDNDVAVLARYVGAPRLGAEHPGIVLLRRPLAHIAIVVDPERRYASAEGRSKVKRTIVEGLEKALPRRYRTSKSRADLRHLVSIHTWGTMPFEFSHFTDRELAEGVAMLSTKNPAPSVRELALALREERAKEFPDVQRAVGRLAGGISKPALADHLWPLLENRIRAVLGGTRTRRPPILRVAMDLRAIDSKVRPVRALRV